MKIYTRTGDQGDTSLFGGGRVPKTHPRVRAYGSVDELNSMLGVARAHLGDPDLDSRLVAIQKRLFDVGADLATPPGAPSEGHIRRTSEEWVRELEADIDTLSDALPPLSTFVLPGGSPAAAALHLARAVCRRAERDVLEARNAGESIAHACLTYLNRLSDWLFVAARTANLRSETSETLWQGPKDVAED